MSGGKGGGSGCMGPVGLVLGLGLVVWLLVEPESFKTVFVQMGETFIDLVRTVAEMIERESAGSTESGGSGAGPGGSG